MATNVSGYLFQDWATNRGDKKAQLITFSYRGVSWINSLDSRWSALLAKPISFAYRVVIDWIMGVEIPWQTSIGPRLRLHHAQGIVINAATKIGSDVSIHQSVTVGGRVSGLDCPIVGDGVRIGVGAIIIGSLTVGDNASIGAGAVVLGDVPSGATAVGNPARVVKAKER